MVRVAAVAVLLMQCCNVILAARPVPPAAAAGDDGGRWQLRQQGAVALTMQGLEGPKCPGQGNGSGNQDRSHATPGSCPPPAK
ncbi:hypothetical protein BAE44_0025064 [Dichanthelium oligosanthes]|uniref:Uncharacterized protein n=1 Tax=Dichanthelium oligosanthes TaxID=888268 RepID=A0A1E5UM25_9POAL|nr:hypothetical protein BAE44_0025064 [Dichanthelium oligosanthes]